MSTTSLYRSCKNFPFYMAIKFNEDKKEEKGGYDKDGQAFIMMIRLFSNQG